MRIWFENHFFGVPLLDSLRRSVARFSLSDWSVFVFLLGPFLSIVLSPWFLKGFDRFGVQWHVLLISCVISLALILRDDRFCLFLCGLISSKRIIFALSLFVSWLLFMGFAHGFVVQAESLLSAVMFLLMIPVGLYVLCGRGTTLNVALVSLILLAVIVIFDDLCLFNYLREGIAFGQVFIEPIGPPKVFLNIRFGNFLSFCTFSLLWSYLFRRNGDCSSGRRICVFDLLLACIVVFCTALNALLTSGRALSLCLFLYSLLVLVFLFRRVSRENSLRIFFCMVSSFFLSVITSFLLFACFSPVDLSADISRQYLDEFSRQYAVSMHETRFSLWSAWLRSWADSHFSLMFGHGLGYLPEGLSRFVRTPHNLFIQLIADGGFLGISIVVSLIVILLPLLRFGGASNFIFLCLTWPLYASLSSVLYYPSSVWAASLAFMGSLQQFFGFGELSLSPNMYLGPEKKRILGLYLLPAVITVLLLVPMKYVAWP